MDQHRSSVLTGFSTPHEALTLDDRDCACPPSPPPSKADAEMDIVAILDGLARSLHPFFWPKASPAPPSFRLLHLPDEILTLVGRYWTARPLGLPSGSQSCRTRAVLGAPREVALRARARFGLDAALVAEVRRARAAGAAGVVSVLAGWGASLAAMDRWGCTALEVAAANGNAAVVRALLARAAAVPRRARPPVGALEMALVYAGRGRHIDALEVLLAATSTLDVHPDAVPHVLRGAARRGHDDVAACVLCARPDAADSLLAETGREVLAEADAEGQAEGVWVPVAVPTAALRGHALDADRTDFDEMFDEVFDDALLDELDEPGVAGTASNA